MKSERGHIVKFTRNILERFSFSCLRIFVAYKTMKGLPIKLFSDFSRTYFSLVFFL